MCIYSTFNSRHFIFTGFSHIHDLIQFKYYFKLIFNNDTSNKYCFFSEENNLYLKMRKRNMSFAANVKDEFYNKYKT